MKRLIPILRVLLCALVFVLVLELCARVDDVLTYNAPFWGPYNNEILLRSDKIGRWGKPGARYEKWQLNSLGYRGPELKPGTKRIVCFGASETFGLYEAPGEEYPRQLEHDLNQLAGKPEFQVVNAAFPGETLPTAILRVPEVVSQIHPVYALLYVPPANYIDLAKRERPRSSQSASLTEGILRMRIAERVSNLLKDALPKVVQTELRELEIRRDTAHAAVMQTLPQRNVEQYRQDLISMIDALRDRGVEPILVTHATVFGSSVTAEDQDLLTEWRKFYPTLEEAGFLDMERRVNQVTRETATCEGLTLIDIANEMPHGSKYFADMVHFTTDGAKVMAADLTAGLTPVLFSRAQRTPNATAKRLSGATQGLCGSGVATSEHMQIEEGEMHPRSH